MKEPIEIVDAPRPDDEGVTINVVHDEVEAYDQRYGLGYGMIREEGHEVAYDPEWLRERKERERIHAAVQAAPPLERVATYLREKGYEPLRVWRINGPKGAGGGEIAGWLLQTLGKIVVAHQYPSGRYVLYERAEDI